MELYEKALRVAIVAHKDQVRKTDGSPYVVHPIMVSDIVKENGFDEVVRSAAVVHDVLEDTSVTEEALRLELGNEVVDIVTAVSEDKSLAWEARKELYVKDVVEAGENIWAVSVADKIHNASSMVDYYSQVGPAIWQDFSRGKELKIWFEELLLNSLKPVWQHSLLKEYEELIGKLREMDE
ncbi:bifunctional (p)ppGpp synthetase/guanosine-3',5'-bis(diphosphate) 3'-pyrophosphohydrolase [Candidatus Kaiserbacteria bacterium]|nr:bifunctional (p)ppGpp synthetase/guanosine-3',5'-bis(diphosphate) 3'-pyrophosphohydrolase [Candidatus Kaiserbacteria bacterium]